MARYIAFSCWKCR